MICAIAMVKDEADIIGQTVAHLQTQVDHIIVADNHSTDGTREILEGFDIEVVNDPEVAYYQSRKMTDLARKAAERGATWVVPFDADEIWLGTHGTVKEMLQTADAGTIAIAKVFDHVATSLDADMENPVQRMRWHRAEPNPMHKVACRPRAEVTIHQGNHGADYGATLDDLLEVRHFPYRSPEQFVKKVRNGAAAYAASTLPYGEGQHWRDYGRLLDAHGPEAIEDVFRTYFWSLKPEFDSALVEDPCPC
jgi:glycosyltransferase involved in cell wall biosynthesis